MAFGSFWTVGPQRQDLSWGSLVVPWGPSWFISWSDDHSDVQPPSPFFPRKAWSLRNLASGLFSLQLCLESWDRSQWPNMAFFWPCHMYDSLSANFWEYKLFPNNVSLSSLSLTITQPNGVHLPLLTFKQGRAKSPVWGLMHGHHCERNKFNVLPLPTSACRRKGKK